MRTDRSQALFAKAQEYLPGGVNSPVRAFKSVGGDPLFIARGNGSKLYDVDGNSYIDYVCSWGPLILGHAHPAVVEAVLRAAEKGTSYGAPTELEVELARRVVTALPSVEMVRLVNSGTEATMSAVRLARAYTKRAKIMKFEGCYHGHGDAFLIKAGSGALTLGVPTSPGVPEAVAGDTVIAPYNDLETVREIFRLEGGKIAAVIIEPVAGNMGLVPPAEGFLRGLRALCSEHDTLLIFDEVITGFRVGYGGAQEFYDVYPDLTCLGKIIGGGLPVGAYGGKKNIMELIAPRGPVYQAGTLSGNPLAMAAGIAALDLLQKPGTYEKLAELGARLASGFRDEAEKARVPATVNQVGSTLTMFFTAGPVSDFKSATSADTARYAAFFREMLGAGIYLPPSQFEALFISLAHSVADIDDTIAAAGRCLRAIA
ncbi:MAG: glutamate-1-semialdehyde-2,1-aminomutase [Ammonifex sp.]|nr:MAG: glutamate-1-semialdehyde-2,1-aminomutase [Ammonifex sp.]